MLFDSHMHSNFSTDSKMTIEEIINKSSELSIGCCITDHHDLAYPEKDQFKLDFDEYLNKYSKYRSNKLLLGVEFGINPSINNNLSEVANKYPLDYIIGSIHDVNGSDIYSAFRYIELPERQYFSTYLTYMLSTIDSFTDFDALGHIDYLCRYANYENPQLIYKDHSDLLDAIFKSLIKHDKVLELNTARISNRVNFNYLLELYKRYRELGGRYVTLGSDAHNKDLIGRNFKEALEFIELCDLKGIYYKERKQEYFK